MSDLVAPRGVTILTNSQDALLSIITPAVLRTEADLSVPGAEGAEAPAEAEEGAEAPAEGEEAPATEASAAEEGGEG